MERLPLSVLRQLLPLFIVRKLEQLFAFGLSKKLLELSQQAVQVYFAVSLAVINVLTSGLSSPRGLFCSLSPAEPIR